MPTAEFWCEEPDLLWTYRTFYIEKMKIQAETNNYNAWLNGLYIYDAITKGLYNSFGRDKGKKVIDYVEKPYEFVKENKTEEEKKKEAKEKLQNKIKERNEKIKEILKKNKEQGETQGMTTM